MPSSTFAIHAKISGKITAEEHAVIPRTCIVKSKCAIGAFSYLGAGSVITQTRIGRYCSIATNVLIAPTDHPTDRFTTHPMSFNKNGCFKNSEAPYIFTSIPHF